MIRREMIVGLLGMMAAPFSWLFGLKSTLAATNDSSGRQYHTELAIHLDDERVVYRKTPEGLRQISWDRIKPGDDIVLFDWVDGHIVGIRNMGKACCRTGKLGLNDPVAFESFGCASIYCKAKS